MKELLPGTIDRVGKHFHVNPWLGAVNDLSAAALGRPGIALRVRPVEDSQ